MLSRAQEARVHAILGSTQPGTIHTYCLEHLATAAKISPGHLPDLAVFVRTLHERGDSPRRSPPGRSSRGRCTGSVSWDYMPQTLKKRVSGKPSGQACGSAAGSRVGTF